MSLRRAALGAACVLALVLTGCSSSPNARPEGIDVGRSIVFSDVEGTELALDACVPSDRSKGPFPAVVLVHGGAFREGDRSNMLSLCEDLAQRGYAAFPIDYRLLPSSYPAQVDDTLAAVGWLREEAQTDRFDIEPDRISLLGSSAGGIIALSAANRLGVQGTPLASVVTLSAAGDLTADALQLGDPDPALQKVVLAYLGCKTVEDCPVAEEASPVFSVTGLPPTLLVHGSRELIPLEQAQALQSAISSAGVPATLDVVDGSRHGLQLLDAATKKSILDFLAENSSP
jgi:acetyl esterase/lipase